MPIIRTTTHAVLKTIGNTIIAEKMWTLSADIVLFPLTALLKVQESLWDGLSGAATGH